jgi:type VI secretion system protein ImpG
MSDKLLYYYNNELQVIKKMVAEFAADHPKEAANLRISKEAFDDPHISRLLQGTAFLNARIMHKLDDEFPELIDGLLNIIYPHYLAPIPSFSIVSFEMNDDVLEPYAIPRGTKIETDLVDDQICRFETCYPLTAYPIKISKAEFLTPPFIAPEISLKNNVESILHIEFVTNAEGLRLSEIQPKSFMFYLNGQFAQMMPLYELLFNNTLGVAIANSANDRTPAVLRSHALRQVGFESDEAIINYSSRSLIAYRYLTEFFVFPSKFLFFEVDLIEALRKDIGNRFSIYFYLNKRDVKLEKIIGKNNFVLNCTPISNRFTLRAEPISFKDERLEYRVVPDARQQPDTVVHEVLSVSAVDDMGRKRHVQPFYLKKSVAFSDLNIYWTATQKSGVGRKRSIDTFISITADSKLFAGHEMVISAEVMCSNGTLPSRLPYGGGNPRLHLAKGAGPIKNISCLTPMTNIIFDEERKGHKGKLLSHLALNHLSLEGPEGLQALKEMLKLYNFLNETDINRAIDGISEIKINQISARAPRYQDDPVWVDSMCRGLEIEIYFDEVYYAGDSFFLFSSVLERFFSAYVNINSFTVTCAKHRSRSGILKRWPPRAGLRYTL